jgi:mono/diheme cytochrome c family protein
MRNIASIGLALLIAAGCSKSSPPSSDPAGSAEPASDPAAIQEAQTTFKTLCATCHGVDGRGDGPGAAQLNPKPRDYTDKAWQTSVTDEQIAKTIVLGGAAVGKSTMMPAQPQLREKPAVVKELVKIIRSFSK